VNSAESLALDAAVAAAMGVKPVMQARALTADETGMALYESDCTTKRDVRDFCKRHSDLYHYREVAVYPDFTGQSSKTNAMQDWLLDRCGVLVLSKHPNGVYMAAVDSKLPNAPGQRSGLGETIAEAVALLLVAIAATNEAAETA